ncbi:hypothetical protein EZS27_039292, partial [termite gut metagenome]
MLEQGMLSELVKYVLPSELI